MVHRDEVTEFSLTRVSAYEQQEQQEQQAKWTIGSE